jgi:uncharacterized protein YunC (DUF1805 family)
VKNKSILHTPGSYIKIPAGLFVFVSPTVFYEGIVFMEFHTKSYQTSGGVVEGVQVKWTGFNILLAAGTKGFLACPAIDLDACESFGVAAALVESSPENPIGTLERFSDRKVTAVNRQASRLGITPGMNATDAFALIA